MIDRYTRPEMGHIFSLENKYAIWQEIEVLACEAHAEMGKIGITKDEAAYIREHASFNKEEVDAIEPLPTTTSSPSSPTWASTSTRISLRASPSPVVGCTTV